MRRLALAAAVPVLYVSPALAQSQIQQLPRTSPETATATGIVPGPSVPAHPSTPNPAGPITVSSEAPDVPPAVRPAAPDRDQLSGHLRLGIVGAYGTFSGSFRDGSPIGANLAGAPFVSIDLGLGISRQLELVATADYSTSSPGSGCGNCDSKSWAIGPMIRFHLVEGTRFNPWIGLGVAHRHSDWNFGNSRSLDTIEFTRVLLGGDWYATSQLTAGPLLGFGLNTAYSVPSSEQRHVFATFFAGIRLMLDIPGR